MEKRSPNPDELQHLYTENRHLKGTVAALREELERARFEADKKLQESMVLGNNELLQLKATIQELRDEMERKAFSFDARFEEERCLQRDELKQLQQTIQILRQTLNDTHGVKDL
jgi:hypothetical protein